MEKFKFKKEDFPEWYDEVLKRGEIVDVRYPIKGMLVWKGYGFKALSLALNIIKKLLDEEHEEVYFPLLIPESVFNKERDFLEGFQGEAYVVTHAGKTALKERLYVRPTSESAMYEMFSLWIKGKSDLPLKIYQIVNVFRYETKQTRPLFRVREIAKFKEGHSAHASFEESEEHVKKIIELYKKFFDELRVPYVIVRTPKWDTFPGAEYNYDFITLLPDNKALELGSVINLGQKFAKAFNIMFESEKGKQYVYQTCYGISERVLGAVIAIHGDDKGMVFPSSIAPFQIVIVPILFSEEEKNKKTLAYAKKLHSTLKEEFRVKLDEENKRVGEKLYYWELKGVPLIIQVGPKEVEESTVLISMRDGIKKVASFEEIGKTIRKELEEFDNRIWEKARKEFEERLKTSNRFFYVPLCGREECGKKKEEELNIPIIGFEEKRMEKPCSVCKSSPSYAFFFGRTY